MTRMITAAMLMLALGTGIAAAQSSRRQDAARETTAVEVVNLNTATPAQFETLPGIGPAMSQRIVEYRQRSGDFKKIEELMNVRGIGEATFLKLRSLISVTPPRSNRAAARDQ